MSTSASAASGHGKASGDSSHYHPLYPSNYPLDPSVKDFITSFFATSDVPGLTDEWLGFFREDATLVMGKDKAMGKEEIGRLRLGMWRRVSARKHKLSKVFPADFDGILETNAVEFMLHGDVVLVSKEPLETASPDSEKSERVLGWAAHARLKRDEHNAPWGFAYYRVYI